MKILFNTLLSTTLLFIHLTVFAQNAEAFSLNPNAVMDTAKRSIKSRVIGVIQGENVTINYYSPGVRQRVIWGGLVPYQKVWVTGAHDATNIEVGKPFIIGKVEIPAGKYAIFTIPDKKEWILIINKNWQQHLSSKYDEKDDVVRLKVKPRKNDHTERLQYFIERIKKNKARIAMEWEKLRIDFPITVKN